LAVKLPPTEKFSSRLLMICVRQCYL